MATVHVRSVARYSRLHEEITRAVDPSLLLGLAGKDCDRQGGACVCSSAQETPNNRRRKQYICIYTCILMFHLSRNTDKSPTDGLVCSHVSIKLIIICIIFMAGCIA